MKKLRSLLIDCRIALRKQMRDFQKTELCDLLDQSINELSAMESIKATPEPALGLNKTPTTNQVGLAWQRAARELKFSQPDLYKKLSDDVMRLLDIKTLVDPGTELEQLGVEVEQLKVAKQKHQLEHQKMLNEYENLLGALANAVPALDDSSDRFATALARVGWLEDNAKKAHILVEQERVKAKQSAGPMPNDETLGHVLAGQATFSKDQLDWAMGEAMVLCGFQFTPNELLDQGHAHIAKIIHDARNAKAS
jgi:hypothetical protein